jgi:hypothetical protein
MCNKTARNVFFMLLVALLSVTSACTVNTPLPTTSQTTSPPTTSPPVVGTTGVPGVEIVAVALDTTITQNPGGPTIVMEVKHIATASIISLDVKLYEPNVPHGSPWTFNFGVSQSSLFVPGVTLGYKTTLINGGWGTGIPYFVTITGTYSNGTTFSFRWTPPSDGDFGTITPPTSIPPTTTPNFNPIGNPDDLIGTPGGWVYRVNIIQQGVIYGWPLLQTVDATIGTSANPVTVNYRGLIENGAGLTNNIIFTVVLVNVPAFPPGNPIEATISSNDLPAGISVIQEPGPGWHDGDPQRQVEEIVHIQIAGTLKPGSYTFSFTVSIDGVQQGTLPCIVQVLNGATS